MVDTLTPQARSERMSRIRGFDTKPELKLRRLVHGMGYRYRLYRKDLPGKPDLTFSARRKVIFVHGCFWHRHGDSECKISRLPKSNQDFWVGKLNSNVARDLKTEKLLQDGGWGVLIVWECELKDVVTLKQKIETFLNDEIR